MLLSAYRSSLFLISNKSILWPLGSQWPVVCHNRGLFSLLNGYLNKCRKVMCTTVIALQNCGRTITIHNHSGKRSGFNLFVSHGRSVVMPAGDAAGVHRQRKSSSSRWGQDLCAMSSEHQLGVGAAVDAPEDGATGADV